ncbi:MAG: ACT domain-containing protein [Spartobacteria bacterium]|nr:ACT domain-containing protein [Spartobacteria bacterium]
MYVKQVSIFLENRSGRLAEVAHLLGDNGINIRALSLAETTNFGVLRLIVDQYSKAESILKAAGLTVKLTDVLVIEIPDQPGGLAVVLDTLESIDLNVEYMYAFVERKTNKAVAVFRFDNIDQAEHRLKETDLRIFTAKDVCGI